MNPFWNRTIPKVFLIVVALFAVLLLGAWLFGAYRWNSETQDLRARLDSARMPVRPQTVDFRELEGLPAPVQRYFRAVLEEGQPMVAGVDVPHRHLQHRRDHRPMEAFHLGPEGGYPTAGLRLERARSDDAGASRAGARRLRGG